MPKTQTKQPTSFKELDEVQLKAATDYFGVDYGDNVETARAALAEDNVTWEDYLDVFAPKPEVEKEVVDRAKKPVNVVKSTDMDPKREVEEVTEVITAPANPVLTQQGSYLIKMTRQNPYFEFKKYKFTQENPYAIMPPEDAQEILSTEEGFRQAFPAELQEFYN